jgi:hypothetical protein
MDAQTRAKLESARMLLDAPKAVGDTEIRLRAVERALKEILDALLSAPPSA